MALSREVLLFCQRTASPFFLFLLLFVLWGSGEGTISPVLAQERLARLPVNLYGASFLTKDEGWVAGQLGKIFCTTDGGKNWEAQKSGTNLSLAAVNFVDRTHGWVVGERGVILHSENGGATWQQQQSGVSYPLFDVKFLDRNTGWVVGHWGTLLFTEDGGAHWTDQSVSLPLEERSPLDPAALRDVIDPQTGEVIAKAEQLLTKDLIAEISRRGITGVQIREDIVLNAVFFLDHANGWIVGERGLLLRTEDRGKSWERTTLPRPPQREERTVKKDAGKRAEEPLGEAMSEEELAAFGIAPPPPSLYGVFFISQLQGWAVGQEGTIAWTHDGGRQWEFQPSDTREAFYDVGVAGDGGWIAGDKGTVLVSTNGGRQWERKELSLEYRLFWLRRLAVIPGDHAFLVGANGLVLASGKSPEQGVWIHNLGERER